MSIEVQGPAELRAAFVAKVRRTMLLSPSFAKVVRAIDADRAHPVRLTLVRGADRRLDLFASQQLDLDDLDVLPVTPPPRFPEQTTQGAVLAHVLQELHLKALGYDRDTSRLYAIRAENQLRRDLGQKTMRIDELGRDESHVELPGGGRAIITNFDDGHSEVLSFDGRGQPLGSHWAPTTVLPPPVIPFLLS